MAKKKSHSARDEDHDQDRDDVPAEMSAEMSPAEDDTAEGFEEAVPGLDTDGGMAGADLLKDYDTAFEEADAASVGELPDGKFQGRIKALKVKTTAKGDTKLNWEIEVLKPPHVGKRVWKDSLLHTPEGPRYLKGELAMFGVKLAKLSDLPKVVDQIVGQGVVFRKTTTKAKDGSGKEYLNYYFDRAFKLSPEEIVDADGESEFNFGANAVQDEADRVF